LLQEENNTGPSAIAPNMGSNPFAAFLKNLLRFISSPLSILFVSLIIVLIPNYCYDCKDTYFFWNYQRILKKNEATSKNKMKMQHKLEQHHTT
jgi:hypothetical protein